MVKLSGILEYSMGGFLCLRGFASFKMLSAISESNPEVQRDLIAQHQGEMAEFLNGGEYRFFPEVILSLNLTDGRSEFDKIDLFHSELRSGQTWNKSIGGFQISISRNVTKNVLSAFDPSPRIDRVNIAHLKFDEKNTGLHVLMETIDSVRQQALERILWFRSACFCSKIQKKMDSIHELYFITSMPNRFH